MQEKNWDWKDAPEWATHVGIVPFDSSEYLVWYNDLRYEYVEYNDTPYPWQYGCLDKTKVVVLATRQSEQENLWDGEGIPPNGTICNTKFDGKQYKVKVVCQALIDSYQADEVVAVVGLEGERKCLLWWTNDYQKIKTKEEIEAEKERSRVCDKIYGVLLTTDGKDGTRIGNRSAYAEALYDAGLRFIDKTN